MGKREGGKKTSAGRKMKGEGRTFSSGPGEHSFEKMDRRLS